MKRARIIFTKHAVQQMRRRGISIDDVRYAIEMGAKIREGRSIMCKKYGICVPCLKLKDRWIVKTVYWEGE